MVDKKRFSTDLLSKPEAKSDDVLERIATAKARIQKILDREVVAHQKTLEQKIAEQGPEAQRVDPHLVGLAIFDLLSLRRLRRHTDAMKRKAWYSNLLASDTAVNDRLSTLAPLYASVSGDGFGNLTGDALEIVVFKSLEQQFQQNPRFAYQGSFNLNEPKNARGRFRATKPPKNIGTATTTREADFFQFGHDAGPLCIECKNYREWIYPRHQIIKDHIIRCDELDAIPVLVVRRLHYTTKTNFLEPAGILAHESYFQYYPSDQANLAKLTCPRTFIQP